MKYVFVCYFFLMILTSIIPIYPKESIHHIFIMDLSPDVQNFLHIPMFFIWVLLIKNTRFNISFLIVKNKIKILFLGVFWGCFLEIIQFFIPGRFASLEDILLNLCGIIIGLFGDNIWSIIYGKK